MPAGYASALIGAQVDGTALTGTVAASILPGQAKLTLPANFIDQVGKKFRIRANGRISNIVTTPGTLALSVRTGGGIIVAQGVAWQLNAVAKTNVAWWLDLMLTARTIGSGTAATLFTQGSFGSESVVGSPLPSVGGNGELPWQTSAPVVGTGFDATIANVIDLFGVFSLTGNSLTLHDYLLESLN